MNIEEMHIKFRELGQQMGIQLTRAIYPEDIDNCINLAIDNKIRAILQKNVGTDFADKVERDNANISPINSLYTLYKQKEIDVKDNVGKGSKFSPIKLNIDSSDVYLFTNFNIVYQDEDIRNLRLIEREKLFDTLNDYLLRPSKIHPIVICFGDENNLQLEIYTGVGQTPIKPIKLIYTILAHPKKVKFDEENHLNNVSCDLPKHLHYDILKDAITIYKASIGEIGNQ